MRFPGNIFNNIVGSKVGGTDLIRGGIWWEWPDKRGNLVGVALCKVAGVIIINISSMILLKICELGNKQ
jgi:hypothetical protein